MEEKEVDKRKIIERPISEHSLLGNFIYNPGIQIMFFIYWIFRPLLLGNIILAYIIIPFNLTGILYNIVICIGCFIMFLWYMWQFLNFEFKDINYKIDIIIFSVVLIHLMICCIF